MIIRCPECGMNLIYATIEVEPPGDKREKREGLVLRIISAGIISLLLLLVTGTTIALSNPGHVLAYPFREVAAKVTEATALPISLINSIHGLVATYERNIISEAVQSMRMIEDIKVVPQVTTSTNDLLKFPSEKYALFPYYVDKRYSQFKYTVDSNGIVTVDISGATADVLLVRIEQAIDRLAGRSY